MRKCAFCGMVSHSEDHCEWCKRPFNTFLYPVDKPAKKVRKAISKKTSNSIKIGVLSLITVIALLSFAFREKPSGQAVAVVQKRAVSEQSSGHVTTKQAAEGSLHNATGIDSSNAATNSWDYSPTAPGPDQKAPKASLSTNAETSEDQVHLTNVSLNFEHSGSDDTETAYGKVTIQNLGDHPITDFRMVLNVNDTLTPLVPFEGNINYPMALSSKQIPPHGSLTVAVLTPGHYVATAPARKHVVLEALVHGTSDKVLRDEVPTQ